jgi:hypothetical protein
LTGRSHRFTIKGCRATRQFTRNYRPVSELIGHRCLTMDVW